MREQDKQDETEKAEKNPFESVKKRAFVVTSTQNHQYNILFNIIKIF